MDAKANAVDVAAALQLKADTSTVNTSLGLLAPKANPTFTGTVLGVSKAAVGLGNADNTTDLLKSISTATQAGLDAKAPIANPIFTGTVAGITQSMVGLSNVNNTTDLLKPISTATQAGLDAVSYTHLTLPTKRIV